MKDIFVSLSRVDASKLTKGLELRVMLWNATLVRVTLLVLALIKDEEQEVLLSLFTTTLKRPTCALFSKARTGSSIAPDDFLIEMVNSERETLRIGRSWG